MKTNVFFIGFMLLISLYGCRLSPNGNNKDCQNLSIDLKNPDIVSNKGALDVVSFIKLETTDKCLLSNIRRIIHFDNKLFIQLDLLRRKGNVYVFKDSGEFLYSIARGRGPGELLSPMDMAIDTKNKLLYVLDNNREVKSYSLDGQYVKTIRLDRMPTVCIEAIGDHLVAFDSDMAKQTNYYAGIIHEGKTIKEFMPKPVSAIRNSYIMHPNSFFKIDEDHVLLSCLFSDTIYSVSENGQNVRPRYVLDYNGRSLNQPDRIKDISNISEYMKMSRGSNYGYGAENLAMQDDKLFFTIHAQQSYFVVYDLEKNMATLHTKLFDGLPNLFRFSGYDKECLVIPMDVPSLQKYFEENPSLDTDSKIVKQLRTECVSEDDNPVVLFCKF